MQDAEGFAVIWRNAQRARSEFLGIWFVRLVSRAGSSSEPQHVSLQSARSPRKPANRTDCHEEKRCRWSHFAVIFRRTRCLNYSRAA
jgi:hypothetical protein